MFRVTIPFLHLLLSMAVVGCATTSTQLPTPHPGPPSGPAGFTELEPGVRFQELQRENAPDKRIWLYVPSAPPPTEGYPLVLVPPAGSNLITGMTLVEGDRVEHLPYVRAGYAVVSFDISGPAPDEGAGNEALAQALTEFAEARYGVQDGIAALNRALEVVATVDRTRVFMVGHSSAGTLVLQMAAEEPRVAGVVAFAPVTDLSWWLYQQLQLEQDEWFDDIARASPLAIAEHIKVPLLLVHSTGDVGVPAAQSRALVEALQERGGAAEYVELQDVDHYQTMLDGVPRAIAWFSTLRSTQPPAGSADGLLLDGHAEMRAGAPTASALRFYERACEAQGARGCLHAGSLLSKASPGDKATAKQRLLQACRLDGSTCNDAGDLLRRHHRGEDTRETYRRGCEHGDPYACVNQGRQLMNGYDGPKDLPGARALYARSCDADHREGCYMLALTYGDEAYGTVDHDKEREHMRRACALGMDTACEHERKEASRTGPVFLDMLNTVYAHEKALIECARAHGAGAAPVLGLAITFSSDGKVRGVQVSNPSPSDAGLASCVNKELAAVQIAPFKDPTHLFNVEFKLPAQARTP